jgi:hypothetical protein
MCNSSRHALVVHGLVLVIATAHRIDVTALWTALTHLTVRQVGAALAAVLLVQASEDVTAVEWHFARGDDGGIKEVDGRASLDNGKLVGILYNKHGPN